MAKNIILKLIRFYQKTLSLDHGLFSFVKNTQGCCFFPSCSEYTYQAVEKYGIWKGGLLGVKRILRCHPFAKGGIDLLK
ncbi:MAG: membrane protein insertion efficiency factor YidD [Candidatus Pacebacteria bacterium]|nr:membrane protein insertion efficiency factor YidD [Candidatus Paceibacterota bacterium]